MTNVLLYLQSGLFVFLKLLFVYLLQERSPPLVDDFVYICDDTYMREELLEMERTVLKAIDFDLGIPLSYTFLRRYAQVVWDENYIDKSFKN